MNTQIQLKNLTKTYQEGTHPFTALHNIDLSIQKGEQVAIIGKSGSGKSTLMHVMSLLDSPTTGDVLIEGKSVAHISEYQKNKLRNKAFGFIFQQFFLNPQQSVLNNVALPLKIDGVPSSERKQKAMSLLKDVGLEDKMNEKAVNLSGGQKQRVAIARALVNDPLIIFADEPTGNLDTETGQQVIDLLFGYNKSKDITLIVVTHDQDIAQICKKQIHLSDGKITEK